VLNIEFVMKTRARAVHQFTLSTGRTGTVAISRDINRRALNATALHEPHPRTPLRVVGGLAMERSVPKWVLDFVWKTVHVPHLRRGAHVVVEINAARLGLAPYIAQAYPDARFLHIVRDPVACVQSGVNFGSTPLKRLVKWKVPGWELACVKREVRQRMQRLGVDSVICREALRVAVRWRVINEFYEVLGARLGPRYKLVRFEDLFYGAASHYDSIMNWLGVELKVRSDEGVARYNASGRGRLPAYDHLPMAVRDEIQTVCGATAHRFGYSWSIFD